MNAFQTVYDGYFQPLKEGDINLVEVVRTLLMECGLGQQVPMAYDQNTYIQQAQGKNVEAQRYLLNRYWNLQLLSCPDISIEERYCLIPNGSIEDWVRLFKAKVLPFCIKNQLPQVI